MTRAVSHAGHELAREFEKRVLWTYDDADPRARRVKDGHKFRGTATIGWGNTRHALPVRNITPDEAETYYAEDVQEAIRVIYRYVPRHVIELLPQPAYDALFSMTFNTGPQIFQNDKGNATNFIQALLSADRATEVPIQMRRWDKTRINGKLVVSKGLTARRAAEIGLWTTGYLPPAPPAPTTISPYVSSQHPAVIEAAAETAAQTSTRITPTPPEPAVAQGPIAQRPATGVVTSTAGVAGAAIAESAQQMNLLGQSSKIIMLICVLLMLVGLGLSVYAVIHQHKKGKA